MSGIAAAIGAGVAVLGTGFQISQALNQGKLAKDAQRASAEALALAKQRLEINRLEGIQLPLESYERMMKEMTAQQKQSLTSLQEADERSLAAGVGKLYAAASGETEKAREQMDKAISDREKMIAEEESRIDRALASVSLEEAIGFEKEAAQREQAAAMNFAGAISGLGQAASLYQQSRPLYSAYQGELSAAQALQGQGMYEGMNVREARRQMLNQYSPQQIQNLITHGTTYGQTNPFTSFTNFNFEPIQTPVLSSFNFGSPAFPTTGISPLSTTGIQPIQLPPIK
jgi:hypothetical protein